MPGTMFMEGSAFYYVRFLFGNTDERDKSYGREFGRKRTLKFPFGPGKGDSGVPQSMQGWEILYRRKAEHDTGEGRLQTIDLVVKVPEVVSLEQLVGNGSPALGECRRVSKAHITFTTAAYYTHQEMEYLT